MLLANGDLSGIDGHLILRMNPLTRALRLGTPRSVRISIALTDIPIALASDLRALWDLHDSRGFLRRTVSTENNMRDDVY